MLASSGFGCVLPHVAQKHALKRRLRLCLVRWRQVSKMPRDSGNKNELAWSLSFSVDLNRSPLRLESGDM